MGFNSGFKGLTRNVTCQKILTGLANVKFHENPFGFSAFISYESPGRWTREDILVELCNIIK